ncbi:uncharacterized protein EI90DRAFT_2655174 [Cantharellus anzutake]|uniref:uncharacterized protein n=1 Tax=Cantharellus anzutake TaxID=1750568 RepID=UPI0019056375|nr:uncharacterized protein EI90DRAFT_2655174 [Cantharellus anzutake]KAF8337462.1 hypothetical protein EI90DRAFT_2655174 [Cantharellus anzutake]
MTMANLSRFSFPRALGTLLSLLSAQITQACTLIPPDPAVGITYGVYFEIPGETVLWVLPVEPELAVAWARLTLSSFQPYLLPASIELWSQDTGANDKILNSYPVGPNPIGWAISNVEFIYLTVYFVLRDYHGQKATSPTYVIQVCEMHLRRLFTSSCRYLTNYLFLPLAGSTDWGFTFRFSLGFVG